MDERRKKTVFFFIATVLSLLPQAEATSSTILCGYCHVFQFIMFYVPVKSLVYVTLVLPSASFTSPVFLPSAAFTP